MGERIWDTKGVAVFITASSLLDEGEPYYWLRGDEGDMPGWVKVHTETVRIPRPTREEVLPQQIAAFQEEIRKTRVEAEEKVVKLQEQLENLLAIGYESAQPAGQDFDDSIPF